ncbi:MAG: glycosyltransferase, partial [Planctomycetota bacterium]
MGAAPRKVLLVSHVVECGGAEISLLDLLGGLDRARTAPLLACSGDGPLAQAAAGRGVPVHHVPMLWTAKLPKLFGIVRAAARLARLARAEGVALIHTNTLIAGYCGLWAARRARVPCVWHLRDLGYPAIGRRVCAGADRIVANSQATAAALGRARDRVRVVHNGVDRAFFEERDRHAVRAELGAGGEPVVGMAGRLDPWKGHEDLLEA